MEVRLIISLLLIVLPSVIWLFIKQIHSPWWLENILSTSFIILAIYIILMLMVIYFVPNIHYLSYFLINFILALLLNNTVNFSNIDCTKPVIFFQFNMKYSEKEHQLNELIEHLISTPYHLITLQGVSRQIKREIVDKLSPHYPYFILGEHESQQVYSDQLLFSQYGFSNIKYYPEGHNSFLITSQWKLPFSDIKLHTLHPPSPRSEKLWQTRNKTLYQLKDSLKSSLLKNSLVTGDLNLSGHSGRIELLKQQMNTEIINSWPNNLFTPSLFGLAIDHFWVSKPATICSRERIDKFSWSDHYAIKTQVEFK